MSLQGVGIRRADSADYAELIKLTTELLPGSHWQVQWQERLLAIDVFTYLVEDEAIFGFVTAGPSLLLEADTGEVCGLFLSSAQRGSGMGKKLLVRGLSVLKRRGFDRAVLFVDSVDSIDSVEVDSVKIKIDGGRHRVSQALASLLSGLGFIADVGEREINGRGSTIRQIGYSLALDDYF